jgi:hypothetical protein
MDFPGYHGYVKSWVVQGAGQFPAADLDPDCWKFASPLDAEQAGLGLPLEGQRELPLRAVQVLSKSYPDAEWWAAQGWPLV